MLAGLTLTNKLKLFHEDIISPQLVMRIRISNRFLTCMAQAYQEKVKRSGLPHFPKTTLYSLDFSTGISEDRSSIRLCHTDQGLAVHFDDLIVHLNSGTAHFIATEEM